MDREWPETLPGSADPGQVLESRKLEGRVIIRKAAEKRIDEHYAARFADDPEKGARFSESFKTVLRLLGEWLPREDALASSAINQFILCEGNAGGMVELERLEALGRNGHPFAPFVAAFVRRGLDLVLCELCDRGIRLEAEADLRARTRREAYEQDLKARTIIRDSWIHQKFTMYRKERGLGQNVAVQRLACDYNLTAHRIRQILQEHALWESEERAVS